MLTYDRRFAVTTVTLVYCQSFVSLFSDTGQVVLQIELMMLLGPLEEDWGSNWSTRDEIELPFTTLLREDLVSPATELLEKVAVDKFRW